MTVADPSTTRVNRCAAAGPRPSTRAAHHGHLAGVAARAPSPRHGRCRLLLLRRTAHRGQLGRLPARGQGGQRRPGHVDPRRRLGAAGRDRPGLGRRLGAAQRQGAGERRHRGADRDLDPARHAHRGAARHRGRQDVRRKPADRPRLQLRRGSVNTGLGRCRPGTCRRRRPVPATPGSSPPMVGAARSRSRCASCRPWPRAGIRRWSSPTATTRTRRRVRTGTTTSATRVARPRLGHRVRPRPRCHRHHPLRLVDGRHDHGDHPAPDAGRRRRWSARSSSTARPSTGPRCWTSRVVSGACPASSPGPRSA